MSFPDQNRRRVVVAHERDDSSLLVEGALESGEFEVLSVAGLANLAAVLVQHQATLLIVDVTQWEAAHEQLLCDLAATHSTQNVRKIFLAAYGRSDDKAAALENGADDFLVKPLPPRVLLARIEAVMRASRFIAPERITPRNLLRLDREHSEVFLGERAIKLSATEFHLLEYLILHPGRVFSREELLDNVWLPFKAIEDPRAVDLCIFRLREKIEDDPSQPKHLLTRRGEGYSLASPS